MSMGRIMDEGMRMGLCMGMSPSKNMGVSLSKQGLRDGVPATVVGS